MASSDTDLEAQFRLRMFALLGSLPALQQLIRSTSNAASVTRLDLARFLAVYFLGIDFEHLFAQLNRCHKGGEAVSGAMSTTVFPNLMLCADLCGAKAENHERPDHWPFPSSSSSSTVWDRSRLGQLLPSQCTPNFALRLLLREHCFLEAIFFADHFHDVRTSMALRFLVDRHFSDVNLLSEYCRVTLIEQLLIEIEEADDFSGQIERVHQFIEAIIQADALFVEGFGTDGLLNECLQSLSSKMAAQFNELVEPTEVTNDKIDSITLQMPTIETVKCLSMLLPRPPIYCSNYPFDGMNLSARHLLDTETRVWVTLQAYCSALVYALARSNRLEQLIGFFALWVGRQIEEPKSEVPFLLEADYFTNEYSDAELATEMDAFQTLFTIAMAMEMRDKLVRQLTDSAPNWQNAMPNSNLGTSSVEHFIQNSYAKFCALATTFYEDKKLDEDHRNKGFVWKSVKRWAHLADQTDIESAMLLLHTIQQQNSPTRRFLPSLNAFNRPKWCSLLLMDASSSDHPIGTSWTDHLEVFVDEQQKFKLVTAEFVRFCFLALRFQLVPLPSQPIQILLQLDPNEICTSAEGVGEQSADHHQLHINYANNNSLMPLRTESDQQPIKKCVGEEEEDSFDRLIVQIRQSLALLNEPTTSALRGEQPVNELNLQRRQNGIDQADHTPSSSNCNSDDEYVKQIRARHHDQLLIKQQKQKHYRRNLASHSSSLTTALSSYERTSRRSSSSSRTRTNRQKASLENKQMRQIERMIGSASPSANDGQNEEASDEQLMREMDVIEQRLDWIRQQFQQRTAGRQSYVDEMSSTEETTPRNNGSAKNADITKNDVEIKFPPKEKQKADIEKPTSPDADYKNAEMEQQALKSTEVEKPTLTSAKLEKSTMEKEEPKKSMLLKNDEIAKPLAGIAETLNGTLAGCDEILLEKEDKENSHLESAIVVESADIETSPPHQAQQNGKIKYEQKGDLRIQTGSSSRSIMARHSPPSSAGYHSSRPSTSKTNDHDDDKHDNNSEEQNVKHQMPSWRNAKIQTASPVPIVVERMDFSRLRSSDETDEMEQANDGQQKKPKRRVWKEIEVFPRNSPTNAFVVYGTDGAQQSVPNQSAAGQNSSNYNCSKCQKGHVVQQMPRRSSWRRPHWLRLLPPFDGTTIWTDRQTKKTKIRQERPLLELKLEDHFSTPHTECGGGGGGTLLTNPARHRRTFLELAAKKERRHPSVHSAGGHSRLKTRPEMDHQPEHNKQQSSHANGIYDSGIGLDLQQQQQKQQQLNDDNGISSRNGGIVLYTVELGKADVEAMRRRANDCDDRS